MQQLIRYCIVGILNNAILYLSYLVVTHFGMIPKVAMSLLYICGVLQTFNVNRSWTYKHDGKFQRSFARYIVVYSLAYVLNLLAFLVFVDRWSWSHELVQAGAILIVAVILFWVQKVWVFPTMTRKGER